MTLRNLLEQLDNLEDEQLDMPVMAHVDEEFYECTSLDIYENTDQLADGHPYLQVR
jgi:hypothetical protein